MSVQQILGVLSTDAGQRVAWQATNALREDATLCQCQIHLTHQQNCRLSSPTVVGQLATERASMARYGNMDSSWDCRSDRQQAAHQSEGMMMGDLQVYRLYCGAL